MAANYLSLSKQQFKSKIERLFQKLNPCQICPRRCGVNRFEDKGYCKLKQKPVVSSYHPHFGEEKVLVGSTGSGTIFFTSCNLSCVYCQNYEISQLRRGRATSYDQLAEMMLELQSRGCANINLVTPTCQVPAIVKSLSIAKEKGLELPLVYNTNSYDSVAALKLLDGIIDIYMPDARYSDDEVALKYSDAPNYFEVMKKAIKEMHDQVGDLKVNEQGVATEGLLVRHLVLPHDLSGSKQVFKFLAEQISKNTFLNVMAQYRPGYKAKQYLKLSRPITDQEYSQATQAAKQVGLKRIY